MRRPVVRPPPLYVSRCTPSIGFRRARPSPAGTPPRRCPCASRWRIAATTPAAEPAPPRSRRPAPPARTAPPARPRRAAGGPPLSRPTARAAARRTVGGDGCSGCPSAPPSSPGSGAGRRAGGSPLKPRRQVGRRGSRPSPSGRTRTARASGTARRRSSAHGAARRPGGRARAGDGPYYGCPAATTSVMMRPMTGLPAAAAPTGGRPTAGGASARSAGAAHCPAGPAPAPA